MSDPYIGEIRIFAGVFAPVGWWMCDGTLLPISQFDVLFALLGTTYGGDGQTTFAVPDLRGRLPLHRGPNYPVGSRGGAATVQLTPNQLAQHTHSFLATTAFATQPTPGGNVPAQGGTVQLWTEDNATVAMDPAALLPAPGNGQPHDNLHPFQAMSYIIATEGIYPSRT